MTQPDEVYAYHGPDGRLRYRVLRYGYGPGKRFRTVDPREREWPDPIPEEERILYRLPDLLEAGHAETIFVAEGERDVDTLVHHGFVATTMPCGTWGGWIPSYNRFLRERHVVILPDNDRTGGKHAQDVLNSLRKECISALLLPLGGTSGLDDVTTWFHRRDQPAETLQNLVHWERWRATDLRPGRSQHTSPNQPVPSKSTCIALIRRVPRLSPLQRLLLVLYVQDVWSGGGERRHVAEMAADCGVHRVTCQRALSELVLMGLIPSGGLPQEKLDVRWDLLAAMVASSSRSAAQRRGNGASASAGFQESGRRQRLLRLTSEGLQKGESRGVEFGHTR